MTPNQPEPQAADKTVQPTGSRLTIKLPMKVWIVLGALVAVFLLNYLHPPTHVKPAGENLPAQKAGMEPATGGTPTSALAVDKAGKDIGRMKVNDDQHPVVGNLLPGTVQQPPLQQGVERVDPRAESKRLDAESVYLSPAGYERPEPCSAEAAKPAEPSVEDIMRQLQQAGIGPPSQSPVPDAVMPVAATKTESEYQYAQPDPDVISMPDGSKAYVIHKGTVIEAVNENALIGDFAGPVRCHTTTDLSTAGHLVIPAGSVLLGEAQKVSLQNQQRLSVFFTDLQVPGYTVDLVKAIGLDQQGATALRDKVNHHTLATAATILSIGLLGALAESQSGSVLNGDGASRIESSVGAEAGQQGMEIMQQRRNIPNEILIRPGQRVRVWLNRPLALPEQAR